MRQNIDKKKNLNIFQNLRIIYLIICNKNIFSQNPPYKFDNPKGTKLQKFPMNHLRLKEPIKLKL